jgi:putative transposase
MARAPRFDIPSIPAHLVQRGNNRQRCFVDDVDRQRYLDDARTAATRYCVAIHAYVLMPNHVHLLVSTPDAGATSRMMQALGRRYVAYFNLRHCRTGTLWEGRFHSSPIGTDRYFWSCHRYIECNPVRAGLCQSPRDFRWSSHRHNALGRDDPIVTQSAAYAALGTDAIERRRCYLDLFQNGDEPIDELRQHLRQQRAWGDDAFQARIAAHVGRVASVTARGRPRRAETSDK